MFYNVLTVPECQRLIQGHFPEDTLGLNASSLLVLLLWTPQRGS